MRNNEFSCSPTPLLRYFIEHRGFPLEYSTAKTRDALKLSHDHQRRRKIYLKWRYPEIYGNQAQQSTYEEPGGIFPPPHTDNLNPSPARKMKLEMEVW